MRADLGLSDAWVQRISQANPAARQALSVARLVGGSDAARCCRPGDILLAIDDKPVTQFRDVERAVATQGRGQCHRLARRRREHADE